MILGKQKFKILATICDGIKECLDDKDESSKCYEQEKFSNHVAWGLTLAFFIVCFVLRWCTHSQFKPMEGDGNDETLIQQDFDSLLSQYKKDHFDKDSLKNLNLYFLHFLNSTDESP